VKVSNEDRGIGKSEDQNIGESGQREIEKIREHLVTPKKLETCAI
jgi:hypothetical protein